MYAFITLVAAGIEAGATVVSKKVNSARKQRTMQRAQPLTDAASGVPTQVSGRAVAGPAGTVTAPLSGRTCVWYAVIVRERYEAWRPGPLGPTKVIRHTKVAEHISGPLSVSSDGDTVRVDTRGADLDLGEPAFADFESVANGALAARLTALLGTPPRTRHRERTLGLVVEEHVVDEDDALYVVGQVRTELGDRVLCKPPMRPFIVSRTMPATGAQG